PFPGRDPYIEASGRWRSFHSRLISRIIDMLEESLPEKYTVLPDEREAIELVETEGKSGKLMFREQFIEIAVTQPEYRLVTCIEVLSPSNKRPGSDSRAQYLRKRQALFLGETNLVEIDLLLGG